MEKAETRKTKIKTLVVSIVAVLGLEAVYQIVMAKFPADRMLFLGLTRLIQTGTLIGVIVTLEGGLAVIGLERPTVLRGVKSGLFWATGFGFAAMVVLGLFSMAGVDVRAILHTRLPAGLKDMLLFFLVGGIVAPVAEEVFFRGILYGFFRRWGFLIALVLSTVIFILAHPTKGAFPVTQLVGGVLFAVSYEMAGSLMVPILIHALGNIGIFAVSLVL